MVLNVYRAKTFAWILIVLIKEIDTFVISTDYVVYDNGCQSGFCTLIEHCPVQNRITDINENGPQQYVNCPLINVDSPNHVPRNNDYEGGSALGVCCLEDFSSTSNMEDQQQDSEKILYRTHRDRRAIKGHDSRLKRQTDPNTDAGAVKPSANNNTKVDGGVSSPVAGPALISKYGPIITSSSPPEVKDGNPVPATTTNNNNNNQSNTPVEVIQHNTSNNFDVTKMAYPIEPQTYVPLQHNFTAQKQYQPSQQLTGRASSSENSVTYPQQQQQQQSRFNQGYPSNKVFSSRNQLTYSEPSLENRPSNAPFRKVKLDGHSSSIPDQGKSYNQHQKMSPRGYYNDYKSNIGPAPRSQMSTYYQSQSEKEDVKSSAGSLNKGKNQNGNNRQFYAVDSTQNNKVSNHYADYANYYVAPQNRMNTESQSPSTSYGNSPSVNLNNGERQSHNNRRFDNVYSPKNRKGSNHYQQYQKSSNYQTYTADGLKKDNPQDSNYHKQTTKPSNPSYYLQKSSKYENLPKPSYNVNSGNFYQSDYQHEPSSSPYSGRSKSKVDIPFKYSVRSFKSQNLPSFEPTENKSPTFSTKVYNSNNNAKTTSSSPKKQVLSFRSPIQSKEPPQQYQFTTQQSSNRERQRKRRKSIY